jgi:hypothetical protein
MMSNATEKQVGGNHYKVSGGRQHWDLIDDFNVGYLEGCFTKYVTRWMSKDGLKDLRKAEHFAQKLYEKRSAMNSVERCPNVPTFEIFQYASANRLGPAEFQLVEKMLTWKQPSDLLEVLRLLADLINIAQIVEDEGAMPGPGYVNQD